ncbi:MAG: hypothetical protein ACJA1C_001142 [Crocinitomicaceae bacterium]|jgi:hypothetical protein
MIVGNDKLKHPRGNKKIWRYMDLPKFLDLVTSGELFFANCSAMSDQFEGMLPGDNLKQIKKDYIEKHNGSELESQDVVREVEALFEEVKYNSLVNCWSMNTIESFALWKIYLGNAGSGVGIRTNVSALKKSLKKSNVDIEMGEVSYRNYLEDINKNYIITRKSPFYSYEQELRLFIDQTTKYDPNRKEKKRAVPKTPNGMKVPIDINELIQEIYISPFMGDWFEEMLRKTLKEINPGLVDKIKRSGIQDY